MCCFGSQWSVHTTLWQCYIWFKLHFQCSALPPFLEKWIVNVLFVWVSPLRWMSEWALFKTGPKLWRSIILVAQIHLTFYGHLHLYNFLNRFRMSETKSYVITCSAGQFSVFSYKVQVLIFAHWRSSCLGYTSSLKESVYLFSSFIFFLLILLQTTCILNWKRLPHHWNYFRK